MIIAVDAMGGDKAPDEIVKGAIDAAKERENWEIILVGQPDALPKKENLPSNVKIEPATSVMGMSESLENLRSKRDSSIWVATKLVKDNKADAIVSAGSTGAQMASALLQLKRIPGIDRPAIALGWPTTNGHKALLDVGANSDVKPEQLLQFAIMGKAFAEIVLNIDNPQIALFSNGREESKGNELTIKAHQLLKESSLNFIGNREGSDVPYGDFDVLVCDGFTGNAIIKLTEGLAKLIFGNLKEIMLKNVKTKMAALALKPYLSEFKDLMNPDAQGGAPLLGVNGISIVCHGSSNSTAIKNAIETAANCVNQDFIGKTVKSVADMIDIDK